MAERFIDGVEVTAAILDGEALPLIRLETPRDFYDYEAKYFADDTRYICPCGLPAAQERSIQEQALARVRAGRLQRLGPRRRHARSAAGTRICSKSTRYPA